MDLQKKIEQAKELLELIPHLPQEERDFWNRSIEKLSESEMDELIALLVVEEQKFEQALVDVIEKDESGEKAKALQMSLSSLRMKTMKDEEAAEREDEEESAESILKQLDS